jgi:hypothetical protein
MTDDYLDGLYEDSAEEKKRKAKELLEGMQLLQQEQAQHRAQQIMAEELERTKRKYNLNDSQLAELHQRLVNDPVLSEASYRKSIRKQHKFIIEELSKPQKSKTNLLHTSESKVKSPMPQAVRKTPSRKEEVLDAAREITKARRLQPDEQEAVIGEVLGDFLKS